MSQAPSQLDAGLGRATAAPDALADGIADGSVRTLVGAPGASLAWLLARAHRRTGRRFVAVTATGQAARALAEDLRAFLPDRSRVVALPGHDVSPYLDVALDRRAAMDRLGALDVLARGAWDAVTIPVSALLRRVPSPAFLAAHAMEVRAGDVLERDALIERLLAAGYARTPVAEDPGSFAVRGALVDVYVPRERLPVRIEFDDALVMGLRAFDPVDQRSGEPCAVLRIHAVSEFVVAPADAPGVRDRIRAQCDEVNQPTARTNAWLDDLLDGRLAFGIEGWLPAFHPQAVTLLDFVGSGAPAVIVDPEAVRAHLETDWTRAGEELAARRRDAEPAFPLERLFATPDALRAWLHDATRVTAVAVHAPPDGQPFGWVTAIDARTASDAGGEDQRALATELATRRGQRSHEATLAPLIERAQSWLGAGLRVVLAARTAAQAERLASVLAAYGLAVTRHAPEANVWALSASGRVEVAVDTLSGGFVLAPAALAVVTEEEVFGTRARRAPDRKRAEKLLRGGLDDLRELKVGDFVVHVDHGIGRYLGLERRALGVSAFERMRGAAPPTLELLVIEYAAGDKLFLPVTRLNQIQKYGGQEGHAPRVDRLGGQTFAKTKAKVREHVRRLADDLLKLYAERRALERDPLPAAAREYMEFEATFAFEETPDQARAIDEVLADLESQHPMDRLVCGDVGFGKTEVAIRAAFRVAMAGRQVALLCPTTVLAQQHYLNLKERFRDYPLRVEVLSRFVDRTRQTAILADLKAGKVDVVIGTHRLLSKDVHFARLGLLVVDEEQRFGVAHKERIKSMRKLVDVVTLTATPIPRTMQMAVGGLRDLSLITTPPVDRRAVRTMVARWDDELIRDAIQREMARGGQTFFVYNRIDGLYERGVRLQELLPRARIAVAHGQMGEGELERVMLDFVGGQYDVLCSTAIVESGLDIPRANTILIDRADMFGLAQLYQLRGRVGRSRERAYCYLLTPPPNEMTDEARYRVEALQRFTELGSGFHVASLDMELRGAGDVLGAEQSGNVSLVGFDMFMQMLSDAVHLLRGEPVAEGVDPELNLEREVYIPDDYIDDIGLRLTLYKRFASAETAAEITALREEVEDRFGPMPPPAREYVRAMRLRPALRELRVLGLEASPERVTLHLREDTPLDPAKLMQAVTAAGSPWRLTPDMRLTHRVAPGAAADGVEATERVLAALDHFRK